MISNIGTAPGGIQISLRVTNESEYRAWNTEWNGVKRQAQGDIEGYFGVINLLGPRLRTQHPIGKYWNSYFTYVQLRYDLINDGTVEPLHLGRTFMCAAGFQSFHVPARLHGL